MRISVCTSGTYASAGGRRAKALHRAVLGVLAACATTLASGVAAADAPPSPPSPPVDTGMAHMAGHMTLTTLRPAQPGDRERADAVVAAARAAMAPYRDYHQALADGYRIFLPDVPQAQYHFTRYDYGLASRTHFDASKPTSLLYTKTSDGGYRLVGVMYTDRVDASDDELDGRIPLSVARWHQHTNFCKAPPGEEAAYFGAAPRYGLLGSIVTKRDCEAAGGRFYPHFFGWMVHVYPDETDAAKIWSIDDDDQGHDNMDHSAMPGMNMPGMK